VTGIGLPAARLALILLAALGVRLGLFFHGVRGSDAYAYAREAAALARGEYDPFRLGADWYGYRYTVVAPTALAYRLFGVGDWPSTLWPLLCGLGAIAVVFGLAREIFAADDTALWSALVFATLPLSIATSTGLGPDSFIPVLSGLAVLALLRAERTPSAGARAAWLGLMGLAFYACVSARIVSVILVLFFGGYCRLAPGRRLRRLAGVSLALGLPLAAEAAMYLWVTGDPLRQWHEVAPSLTALTAVSITGLAYYPRAMLGLDVAGFARFSFFFYLVLAGAVLGLASAPRVVAVPLLWLVPVLGYLEFGSISPSRYVPIHKAYQYLSLITVPGALLAGYGVSRLARARLPRGGARLAAAALAALLVLSSLYGTYAIRRRSDDDARPYLVVHDALARAPVRPVWVHHFRWKLFLEYFFRYQRLDIRMVAGDGRPPRDAYLVVHDRYLYWTTTGQPIARAPGRPAYTQEHERLPEYLFAPPEEWRLLEEFTDQYGRMRLFFIPAESAAGRDRERGPAARDRARRSSQSRAPSRENS
jgi:4-amino-4-deoxy-L-arabinose transferase-like glycosyltransferase